MTERYSADKRAREEEETEYGIYRRPIPLGGGAYIIPEIGILPAHQGMSSTESFEYVQRAFAEGRYKIVKNETQETLPEVKRQTEEILPGDLPSQSD